MELIVRHQGREEKVRVDRTEGGYLVVVGERSYQVDRAEPSPGVNSLLIEGRQTEVVVYHQGGGRYRVASREIEGEVEVTDPLTHLALQTRSETQDRGPHQVTAYMPGRVVSILVAQGEVVAPGQGIVVLEAMKMENEIQTESGGVLQRLFVQTGQAVEAGDPLFEIG